MTIPESFPDGADLLLRSGALDLARRLPDGRLDLIYLDPPYGTGQPRRTLRGRNHRFETDGEVAFRDGRSASPWLPELLVECRRLLRPGGAFFLHLDYHAAHRARILLEGTFGVDNFLNEIVWHYATGGIANHWFARKHDTILYFRNGPGHTFHRLKQKKYLAHRMSRRGVEEFRDEGGWYRWRSLDDVWEIPWLTQDAKERTGYPTQKPVALLERILEAASDPGDLVADFCCGSGTTAVAARRLGRRWVVCDLSPLAVRIAGRRLEAMDERSRGSIDEEGNSNLRPFLRLDWLRRSGRGAGSQEGRQA